MNASSFSDGSLARYNNVLYGIADRGGSFGKGVLFSFNPLDPRVSSIG